MTTPESDAPRPDAAAPSANEPASPTQGQPAAAPAQPGHPAPSAPAGPAAPATSHGYPVPPAQPGYAPPAASPGYPAPYGYPGQAPQAPAAQGYPHGAPAQGYGPPVPGPAPQGYVAQPHLPQGYAAQAYAAQGAAPAGYTPQGYPASPPGYGVPPQHPYPYYPPKPQAGALSWGLGFLAYIPLLGVFIAGIVMAAIYRNQAQYGPVAEGNARNAGNWGLTYIAITLVCIGVAIISVVAVPDDGGAFVAGLMYFVWFAAGATHLVLIIMGLVRANSSRVLNVPFAIPFIRL